MFFLFPPKQEGRSKACPARQGAALPPIATDRLLITLRTEPMTRPLLKFFSLTFGTTWTCWTASFAISRGSPRGSPALAALAGVVFLLGVFAPALVALLLTERTEGRTATQTLLRRILKWRV